jgi:hypothetical protein
MKKFGAEQIPENVAFNNRLTNLVLMNCHHAPGIHITLFTIASFRSALLRQRPPHLGLCVWVPTSSNMGGPCRSGRLQPSPQHCHLRFKRKSLTSIFAKSISVFCTKLNVRHFSIFRENSDNKIYKKIFKGQRFDKNEKR